MPHEAALEPQHGARGPGARHGLAQQHPGGLFLCVREPRASRAVLRVGRVHRAGADPGGLGDEGLLPHRLPAAAPEEVPAEPGQQQRQQRQRGRRLGHRLGPLGAETPPLREDFEQERVHLGRGAGARPAAGGARAHHQGDLDERAARGAGDPQPQPLLLGGWMQGPRDLGMAP